MATGAISPPSTVSISTPSSARIAPPQPRRSEPSVSSTSQASSLGASSTAIVAMNTNFASTGSTCGQLGNSSLLAPKYSGRTKRDCSEISTPREQEEQPERRGDVAADPHQQMQAADPVQAARRQHARMLQIALAPAPVAHREVGERGRALLVAAGKRGHHVDRPAAAPHQRRLDEIMAQDVAAERPASAQLRQPRLLGEGARADHRVVAPVIALRAVPPGDAVRDQRPIDAAGELLHPGEQRAAVDDERQRLDQPDIRMPFHRRGEPHDGGAVHHAVRIERHHLRIGAAEPPHPFGDVAGFALACSSAAGDRRCAHGRRCARAARGTPPPPRSRHPGRWYRSG